MVQKHKWAKEIIAFLSGEKVQCSAVESDTWFEIKRPDYPLMNFDDNDYQFRIAPKTININGHEVPQPLREAPEYDTACFFPCPCYTCLYGSSYWNGDEDDLHLLKIGFVHLTPEAATKHAEALLSFTQSEAEQ